MSGFGIVAMNCTIYTMSCNSTIHAICLITLTSSKYVELEVVIVTQKLSCKANCKTPFSS
jgi:hypothetical protein